VSNSTRYIRKMVLGNKCVDSDCSFYATAEFMQRFRERDLIGECTCVACVLDSLGITPVCGCGAQLTYAPKTKTPTPSSDGVGVPDGRSF
jgi:hypothetical protein